MSVQCVTCKNDNSARLHFLIMSPELYFYFIFCLWRVTLKLLKIFEYYLVAL